MATAPATISSIAGYPQAARVIQAPATYTGATIQGATLQSGSVVGQARTIGTASPTIISSAQPRTIIGAAPAFTTGPITSQSLAAMPAKVISAGTQIGTAQPTIRTVAAGATTIASAPRIIQSGTVRPATVVSSATPIPAYTAYSQQSATQAAYEAKHQDDPQLQNLKELRKSCGLKNVSVNDALQAFKNGAVDGKLTREQFFVVHSQIMQQFGVEMPPDDVKNAVFDLFDRDDNGVVDMMELICGASLLCTGTEEDKIHAVFDVFDENGDGVISMDEMFKFLTSVFKVVLTPNVMAVMNTMGVTVESPEDLASVTALECFKTADLNHDGRLSVEEFKNWFFAPRNDPSFLFSPVRKMLA